MSNLAKRSLVSLTRLGPKRSLQTLLSMADDAIFDWRLGTDTTGSVPQSKLKVLSPDLQAQAKPYVMTRARALTFAFGLSGAPKNKRLLDIGCGKGKAVITAALFGFKRVLGIEFAPELVEVAQKNLHQIRQKLPKDTVAEVVCADATQFEYGPDDCVFFLYNPFAGDVMRGFCQQLGRSLAAYPRELWIIYADPAFINDMRSTLPTLHEQKRGAYGGFEIVVLKHTPD